MNIPVPRRRRNRTAIALIVFTGLLGCRPETAPAPDLRFDQVRVRQATVSGTANRTVNSAAYLIIRNLGKAPDRLIGATFEGARRVEVHETRIDDDGLAMMQAAESIVIPAGAEVRLEPGGLHVMLMGLERSLVSGEEVELTLLFENSGARGLVAKVQ
ncbi:MAG: copper chaperone PCu(A)C [marine benthic group bacterium]|nr:copper chaperone PCu(A)C [Gemmatimonadota bacterium]